VPLFERWIGYARNNIHSVGRSCGTYGRGDGYPEGASDAFRFRARCRVQGLLRQAAADSRNSRSDRHSGVPSAPCLMKSVLFGVQYWLVTHFGRPVDGSTLVRSCTLRAPIELGFVQIRALPSSEVPYTEAGRNAVA
jgi:hypothetical protein